MKPGTLLRLALAGSRTDGVRVALTGFSALLATLAILSALTVIAIPELGAYEHNQRYRNALLDEPGLRAGTVFTLLLLTVPILALAGQCARLGAPARDRRLAALRLAGATPGQATLVAVAETGVAAVLGVAAGLGVFFAARPLLDRPGPDGLRALPTDVLPEPWQIAVTAVALPLVAALAAALLLRRVVIGPLGVVRRVRRQRAPLPWPGVLIVLGLVSFGSIAPVLEWFFERGRSAPNWLITTLGAGGTLAATLGVILGTGWISYAAGRLLHRFARWPSALLAARRLTSDPWHGARTFAALLACVFVGAGAAEMRSYFRIMRGLELASARDGNYGVGPGDGFYLDTMNLVDLAIVVAVVIAAAGLVVAVGEGIVARRQAYAAVVASGVPRSVLARSILWHSLVPIVPSVLLALVVGTSLIAPVTGSEVSNYGGSAPFVHAYDTLAAYGLLAVGAVVVTVGIGLLFLRSSTAVEELRTG
ncbi:FtsX-like permease family protein [Asanoa hainanensis]|uniref:FtsX-like permease family protein n=1 Tax=Asanoa hainanensis TaxID=560556 RepID=A0A239L6X7_9ACTN|nr:FtsX-like permease family protein [Asanoa hainanensis]SNT26376.1 FtsX-like permease family protein [Asanoa hainanensis]